MFAYGSILRSPRGLPCHSPSRPPLPRALLSLATCVAFVDVNHQRLGRFQHVASNKQPAASNKRTLRTAAACEATFSREKEACVI
jgi:hypothetical protein